MLFHTTEAWNLAEAMYSDRRMGYEVYPYVHHKFEEGYQNGWMRPHLRQAALEMFVLADRCYLPPDLDIPTPSEEHMAWYAAGINDKPKFRSPNDPLEMERLADYIIPHLLSRKHLTSAEEYWRVVKRWQREVERRGDYLPSSVGVEGAIDREFFMAYRTVQFAANNIPTFSHIDIRNQLAQYSGEKILEDSETALRVVRVYFKDQILVPAPDTFSQALELRENTRIQEWRKKVAQWCADVKAGRIAENRISEEIDEANGYLQGASLPTRILPELSTSIIIPLAAAYELMLAPEKWAHAIALTIIGVETVKALGSIATRAVQGPDPLKYKWLLVKSD